MTKYATMATDTSSKFIFKFDDLTMDFLKISMILYLATSMFWLSMLHPLPRTKVGFNSIYILTRKCLRAATAKSLMANGPFNQNCKVNALINSSGQNNTISVLQNPKNKSSAIYYFSFVKSCSDILEINYASF